MFVTGQLVSTKRRLQIVIALMIVLGIVLRFTNVAHKPYWHDEVFTTVRVVGYTGPEIEAAVLAEPVVTAAELQQFQMLAPDRGWDDTLKSLATHPEHPPLFYLLERGWIGLAGTSPTAMRLLSVGFSLAALPLMYGFVLVLFNDSWAAGIATALLAVSPVQLLYAQEAREYSLWSCTVLLSSGLLLRALRQTGVRAIQRGYAQASWRRSWDVWVLYSVSLALSFYTTVLSSLVVAAQGVYVLVAGSKRQWLRFGLSLAGAIALFSPWLWVVVQQSQKLSSVTSWTRQSPPPGLLPRLWGLHLSSALIDVNLPPFHWSVYIVPPLVLVLVLVALALMPVQVGLQPTLFCGLLLLVPTLGLILPDLIQGGQRSGATRYFLPSLLMVLVVLAVKLRAWLLSRRVQLRLWGQVLWVVLLMSGLGSGVLSASQFTWWNKGVSYHTPVIAETVRSADRPLVLASLSANGLGNAIALSYQVPNNTAFMFFRRTQLPPLPPDYSDYFVPYASGELIAALEAEYGRQVSAVEQPGVYELWELAPAAPQ